MANRQYIGARYVPKFYQGSNGNEWDAGVVYEPLTVVTYLNCTYTSKKPVPARSITPNLDTEYWILTSSLNAQIIELKEDMVDVKSDIARLDNRKFFFIGDSFGEGANGWIQNVVNRLALGSNYYSYAEGGIGYCNVGNNTGLAIENAVKGYVTNNLTTDDIASVTDIVIILGENDTKSEHISNIPTAVTSFLHYLYVTFTNVRKITVGYNGTYLQPANVNYGSRNQYKKDVRQAIEKNCLDLPHVAFFPFIETSVLNTGLVEADGVHPTTTGYQMMARSICSALNGGEWNYNYQNDSHGLTFVSGLIMSEIVVNANTYLYNVSDELEFANGFTTIGTWTDLPLYPKYNASFYIPLVDVLLNGSTRRKNLVLRIKSNGEIQIFNPDSTFSARSLMNTVECKEIFNMYK